MKGLARESRWVRVDVTAPESPRWERTRRFYEREGFTFTGPKLKYLVRYGDSYLTVRKICGR